MRRSFVIAFLCAASAFAQTRFAAPVAGIARDSDQQQIRIVHGVSGTFLWHETISKTALAWAFDGNSGLVKTDSELLAVGKNGVVLSRRPAPQREAVLSSKSAFFPQTGEFWEGANRVAIDPDRIAGRVIAIDGAQLAVCRSNTLWLLTIDANTGRVTHEIPPGGAIGEEACAGRSLLLISGRMLLAAGHAILIQTAAGVERKIPLPANQLARAGGSWIQVEAPDGAAHMIRITPGGERVYQLPAAKERP